MLREKKGIIMINIKDEIQDVLNKLVLPCVKDKFTNNINYETFGKDVESPLIQELIKRLGEKGFKEFIIAPDKNAFPDLEITDPHGTRYAIDIKSVNHSKREKGKWGKQGSPGNDLGSFDKLKEVHTTYDPENVFFAFVHYNYNDRCPGEVLNIELDNHYAFFGKNKDGFIKYRLGDGKVRPKTFKQKSFFEDAKQMLSMLHRSEQHWSQQLAKKAIARLDYSNKNELLTWMATGNETK